MPIDPRIPLAAQVGNFDQSERRLRNEQRTAVNLQNRQREQEMRTEAETVELLKTFGSDITPDTIKQVMRVNPRAAMNMQTVLSKQQQDQAKAQEAQAKLIAEQTKARMDARKMEFDEAKIISDMIGTATDETSYFRALTNAIMAGVSPEKVEMLAQRGYDPVAVKEFSESFMGAADRFELQQKIDEAKLKKAMEPLQREKLELELAEKRRGEDGLTNAERAAQQAPTAAQKEFNPFYEQYLIDSGKPRNAKTELEARRMFETAKRAEVPGVDVPLSPQVEAQKSRIAASGRAAAAGGPAVSEEGLDMMARTYLMTEKLPARSAALNAKIISRAAELNAEANPYVNRANYDSNRKALEKLTQQANNIEAFEKTALANLDLFLGTAKQVIDSGSPALNKPFRKIVNIGGGSELQAAFDTARQVAVNEIAKVLTNPGSNAVLSDSARKEVSELIREDATLKQIYAAANILKRDMENRKKSMDEQLQKVGAQIRTGAAPEEDPGGKADFVYNPKTGKMEAQK